MNSLYTHLKRMMFPLMISAILVSSLITDMHAQTTPPEERAVLMALYNSTGGVYWTNNTNWGVEDLFTNNWYGVTYNGDDTVGKDVLTINNLRENLPPEIENLKSLAFLDFGANHKLISCFLNTFHGF